MHPSVRKERRRCDTKIIRHQIPYVYGDTISLKPIADVHIGNKLCDMAAFKKYLASDDKALFIGLGDLMDSIIIADRRYQKSMDGTQDDGIIDEQVNTMYEVLKDYAPRIVGLGEGNHERVVTNRYGSNPTKRLCELLNVPYLGYTWICKLVLRENDGRGRSVSIYGHHGWGGGKTQGADLTKYSKIMAFYDCDIFLFGHTHRLVVDRIERLGLSGDKLIAKPQHMAVCGTFLKTISPDETPSWAETKGFQPARIGAPTISIKPNNSWVDINITT